MSRIRTISILALALAAACDRTQLPSEPAFTPSARRLVTGTVLTVQNTGDAGPGSLRQAIADAASGDAIEFAPAIAGQTVQLTGGELVIDKTLTIVGSASAGMRISGGFASRVVNVTVNGDATLQNLTITGGLTPAPDQGGGLYVAGKLTLDHSTVSENTVAVHSSSRGGGIFGAEGSEVTVNNSTISGNRSESGGAIYAYGIVTLVNATITANRSNVNAAVEVLDDASTLTVGMFRVTNSIIALNSHANGPFVDCYVSGVPAARFGRNLLRGSNCGTGADVLTDDPMLGPLADNGGPTYTHALLAGSPGIDAALDCSVTTDQRYVSRPQLAGGACDLGAYEFDDYIMTAITVDPTVAVNPNTGVAIVTGTLTCSAPAQISLDASLEQTQRNARTTVVARASASMPVSCTGPRVWSMSMVPPTGAFQNGSATATLATSSADVSVAPTSGTTTVKMYWGHK